MSSRLAITPTQEERTLARDELIVSKTDLTGKITYANHVFQRIARYTEAELLGAPHSILRHPDMPRILFKVAWDTIAAGNEIFAYVKNLAKDGAFYWVFAHITPTFDASGQIVAYHSNRRAPRPEARAAIEPIYARLLEVERAGGGRGDMERSGKLLADLLASRETSWERLMFQL